MVEGSSTTPSPPIGTDPPHPPNGGVDRPRWSILFSTPVLLTILLVAILGSCLVGAYPMSVKDVICIIISHGTGGTESIPADSRNYLIWDIRLPRIFLGLVVGAGLSTSGAAIQGLFRNPLADPSLIGITTGAMVFAVAAILFQPLLLEYLPDQLGYLSVAIAAFAGSLFCTVLVYRLSTSNGRTSVITMLLAGIAITALGGALVGLMTYFSTEEELRDITFWTLGSLSGANWKIVATLALLVGTSLFCLLRVAKDLDLLLLGEREAKYLGVNTQRVKLWVVVSAALAVGSCVAMSGAIGFIALVVPHLIRLSRGTLHRPLLINSALLGAIILILSDALARSIIAPVELPIGILTALLGAPVFIGILRQTSHRSF